LNRFFLQLFSTVLILLITLISGCNSGSLTNPLGSADAASLTPALTPSSAVLLPSQSLQFSATKNGAPLSSPIWLVNKIPGGSSTTGTISSSGLYTAPPGKSSALVQVSVRDAGETLESLPAHVSFFNADVSFGNVINSNNPLVAAYSIRAPQGASAQVQFGTTTNYGLSTSVQPAPQTGGSFQILVAGMRASSIYHMQATLHLADGSTLNDADHVFTTGPLPAGVTPNLTIQQTPGLAPASGLELLCLFEEASQNTLTAVITDLEGNVVWYYPIQPDSPFPMKLLPNGHMLVTVYGSALNAVQEIDLAGNVISQVALADVQQGLATAGFSFPALANLHHDVVKLPNGHLILLVNFLQATTNQPGITNVTGDALIDWDPQKGPVWTWSTFDHIPLTHAPNGTTDWTHANAIVYSPDDGNLLLSMRNQNWIIKVNYQNGTGDGKILWHLGPGGDFTLPAGDDPIEWNYGQHYPVFLSPNTSGIISIMFFNNGNNRMVDDADDVCGTANLTPCYSSVPTFQLNEYTNTAQVSQEINLAPFFSVCCGNANLLPNGNIEYDVAANVATPGVSTIQEVTNEAHPQLVWQMNVNGQLAYRGFRIPSLYPGVEWTQSAIETSNAAAKPAQKVTQ
jgi:arylsulfate sulfotransferase